MFVIQIKDNPADIYLQVNQNQQGLEIDFTSEWNNVNSKINLF